MAIKGTEEPETQPRRREKIGDNGLSEEQEWFLKLAVDAFEDTQFTVTMFCKAAAGADADRCLEVFSHLHACGCLRKPHNDGGQEYYQVMPGIVHPKKSIGG